MEGPSDYVTGKRTEDGPCDPASDRRDAGHSRQCLPVQALCGLCDGRAHEIQVERFDPRLVVDVVTHEQSRQPALHGHLLEVETLRAPSSLQSLNHRESEPHLGDKAV